MMNYDILPVLLRIVLMFGLFLTLCGSIHMLLHAFRRKSRYLILATIACTVLSASMMVLYAADVRSQKKELPAAMISRWLCEKPIVYVLLILGVMAAFLTYSVVREMRLNKITLTRSAIKESIDHLPTGLCFHEENGRVLLVNHCMNRLCYIMMGHDLQNASLMWEKLCSGQVKEEIVQLKAGTQPSFRLTDGTVWTFAQTNLQGVLQITASDTTQLQELVEELEQKNIALEALYQRLKEYEKDVERLTRDRERLETKIGIHSELGQTLLATRSYLLDNQENKAVPLEAWKRSIALLRQNIVENPEQFTLKTLVKTAAAFGISVEVNGQMAEQKEVEKLFLEAATEALTNAVRHAKAQKLYIYFSETVDDYQVCFRNDGKLPETTITEGGGLSALRRKVETAGGIMRICCQPEYSLAITMKKERNEYI